ncbi:hypothetical protein [Mastigocladopsis repens]|uniref:hypothetical protein n=1 Tax=Mastigocladopsis repens TaxID=221287 RepID=UPI000306C87F|nr:hypothetical protein [Mastigocladopsis repens]
MTSEHPMYSRFINQQKSEYSEWGQTQINGKGSLKTVNDEVQELKAGSYEERKTERDNNRAFVSLLGSFVLMSAVSLVACNLFPAPSQHDHSNSANRDVTPMITPVHVMGFN